MAYKRPSLKPSRTFALLALSLGLVLAALTGCVPVPAAISRAVQPDNTDPASLLADRYGIQITALGLTLLSSAVDVQYRVVHAGKAAAWLKDEEAMPGLMVEGSETEMRHPPTMMHMPNPILGRGYHMLLPNAGSAIKRGDRVMVLIDGLSIGPILAQ
jgi:hypothetical protein